MKDHSIDSDVKNTTEDKQTLKHGFNVCLRDQRDRDTAACVYMSLQVAVYGIPQTEKQRATRMKVISKATAHEKGENVGGFHQRGGELQMLPPSTLKKE